MAFQVTTNVQGEGIVTIPRQSSDIIAPAPTAIDPAAPAPVASETPSVPATEPPETPETPAPAEDSAPDDDTDSEESEDLVTVPEHQRRKPTRDRTAEARIRQLTAEKHELARERDAARAAQEAMARMFQGQPPGTAEPHPMQQSPATVRPNPDHFPTQTDYIEALTDWKLAQREAAMAAERQATLDAQWNERVLVGQQTYDDFDLALSDPSARFRNDLVPVVRELVIEQEDGHILLYHLLTDPALRADLDERTPTAARKWLRSQLARLRTAPAVSVTPEPAPTPPRPRRAPPPPVVTPVTGANGVVPARMDPASIAERGGSFADYAKARGPYRP